MVVDKRQAARDMVCAEFNVSWQGLVLGRKFIDRIASLMLAFADRK